MNTTKTELHTDEQLEDFSKIEIITMYQAKAREVEEMRLTIESLRALLRLGASNKYGPSSEQRPSPEAEQLSLFDELPHGVFNEAEAIVAEEEETPNKKGHARRIKGEVGANKSCFDHLPVEYVYEDLPEDQQDCPVCGTSLKKMTTNERTEIEIIPPQFIKKVYIQQVYVCEKCAEEGIQSPVMAAPTRLPVIPGSYVSASLMAYIMAKKCWEKTPIYRMEKQFQNSGIKLSRATMAKWYIDGAQLYLKGVYDLLHEELLKSTVIHADETRCQVLKEKGRKAQQQSFMWHYASGASEPRQIRLYEYKPGRSAEYVIRFLDGYKQYLQTDGYQAYRLVPGVTGVGCMAHARRKFMDILKSLGSSSAWNDTKAQEGLEYFDELFLLERSFAGESPERRYQLRLEQSKPQLEALKVWLVENRKGITHNSSLGQAIKYCINQWDQLIAYLEDGRLEMTNNRAERGIKEFVIGRKNYLFSTSVSGAQASEVIFSIVETAKANDLHPFEYLKFLIEELSQHKQTPEKLAEVMPWSDSLPEKVKVIYRQKSETPKS